MYHSLHFISLPDRFVPQVMNMVQTEDCIWFLSKALMPGLVFVES